MNINPEDYLPKISLNLSIDETQQIISVLEKAIPEFRDRFSRVTDPGSTSPTYKPSGSPREWGDYGEDD
jgi:hypothetical protein